MKHKTKFRVFLNDTVNLNQTRIDTLKSRTATIKAFLKDSSYDPDILRFSTQGSWAHKTIIKPVKMTNEFDADMVVYVDEVEGWDAKDYINELYDTFRDNGVYKPIVGRKSRCVTLDYSGDFHLDIVPITVRKHMFSEDTYRVCNRNTNLFELTDGDGFKDWWKNKDKTLSTHRLIKVGRLIKYLRDTKTTFSCKSILLTTLIGNMIYEEEDIFSLSASDEGFEDVPTTLKTVMGRLDEYLQREHSMPDIRNPVLSDESFTRNWTEDQYQNFRKEINKYRGWVDDAYDEPNRHESIRKWRKLFGDGFAQDVLLEASKTNAMATSNDFEFSEPQLLLKEVKAQANDGIVETRKLLDLIHFGISGKLKWEPIKEMALKNYHLSVGGGLEGVAKINYYQVARHRGISLASDAIADVHTIMSENSYDSGYILCGNLLLGSATKKMLQDCMDSSYGDDTLTWPIMKLATFEV